MKKLITSILFLAAVLTINAQDARQRTVETVVADVLAAMPANNAADFNAQIADLAAAAPASVVETAKMLRPAGEGVRNNLYEYALTGLASYASTNPQCVDNVREGFAQAIKTTADSNNKALLLNLLRQIAKPADAQLFKEYVSDPALASAAVGALVDIPGTEDLILDLVKEGAADRKLLAAAAAEKGITAAEPYIQEWVIPSVQSSDKGDNAFLSALAAIGSESSLNILKENSTPEYAALAVRLADGSKSKAVAKAAKALMASEVSAYKSAGALAQMRNDPAKALKVVSAALKSDDIKYRNSVIENATSILGADNLVPLFTKNFAKLSSPVKVDVLNWFGDNKVASVSDIVLGSFSESGEITAAAIAAAGKIGGDKAAKALVGQLGGENDSAALTALKSFRGDLQNDLLAALDGAKDNKTLGSVLSLVMAGRMTAAAPKVYSLIESKDAEAASLARLALADIAGVQDIDKVGALLDNTSSAEDLAALQKALIAAVHTLAPDEQYAKVGALMKKSKNVSAYYPVLAATGTDEAVHDLAAACESGDKSAFASLLAIDNFKAAPVLARIAGLDASLADKAVKRYSSLVSQYETDIDRKRMDFAKALELAQSPAVKRSILGSLASVPTMKAFLLAGKYLDDSDQGVRHTAAECVRTIASKTQEEINYADLKSNLDKAVAIFKAAGGADDGYAVDEIGKILSEAEPSPVSQLTEEEKRQESLHC